MKPIRMIMMTGMALSALYAASVLAQAPAPQTAPNPTMQPQAQPPAPTMGDPMAQPPVTITPPQMPGSPPAPAADPMAQGAPPAAQTPGAPPAPVLPPVAVNAGQVSANPGAADVVTVPRAEYENLIRTNATNAALSRPPVDDFNIGKMIVDFAPVIALVLIPLIMMVKYRSEQRAAQLLLEEYSSRSVMEDLATDLRANQERQAALMNTIVAALELQGKIRVSAPPAPAAPVVPPPTETI